MTKKKTILISVAVLLVSAVVTLFVFMTEPEAQREAATKKTAMLVDVVEVNRGDYTPTVIATGSVQAAKDITLSPQVGGEIISVSENFIPGSFVKKGEVLLQINPADYRNVLQLRQSDLQLARTELSVEMGRQNVARKDFELIGGDFSPEDKALVLRKPQLEAAKANVAASEAAVSQARLDLQRTTIRAPFDAHIISRDVNVGSQVAPGAVLGRLVGMDEYWVVANVPLSKVNWLSFAENEATGASEVKIIDDTSWPEGVYRKGKLFRLVGALEPQTRLARVLIAVPDPLARMARADTVPPLMIGTFVEAHIEAREIQDAIRLNRDYLRKDETVWVMEDGKLRIRDVEILFQDAEYAYIKEGLSDRDRVVTTDLSTVVEGAGLRTEKAGAPAGAAQQDEGVQD
ncbi:RND family efflux transporter MFP subunit [Pontibacter ummariensis]|uniref:RND family efflux transporter, MFP subunit n=1 Tax=Pontibacter ummariensis TaxID=1610492 RepID=A0A239LCQ1_9BACT|nr:efflux RND transporter periplasmic adaptor subunit [Pontibacter ummariensis]PRY03955.1 RND family efflux transporter MFP subunit [Pontibacter ummariensis]SNT27304.1 RND family efflux transporter, MFP subunit [Pontibacter ummariensis]